jgi:hypothetical protein
MEENKIKKEILEKIREQDDWYEFKPFLDSLPEELPMPDNKDIKKVTNERAMTEKEMTDGRTPFSKEEAFGLAAKLIQEGKDGFVWFEYESNLYRVRVRGGGKSVFIFKIFPTDTRQEGNVSFFRN